MPVTFKSITVLSETRLCGGLQKGRLVGHLLYAGRYEKDTEPPLMTGDANTTVSMGLTILCATPVDDYVAIETWTKMVGVLDN